MQLGYHAPEIFPPVFLGAEYAVPILRLLAYMAGLWLWGLSVWFFLVSVGSLWKYIRPDNNAKIPFQMTWFSFVFPNTALVRFASPPSLYVTLLTKNTSQLTSLTITGNSNRAARTGFQQPRPRDLCHCSSSLDSPRLASRVHNDAPVSLAETAVRFPLHSIFPSSWIGQLTNIRHHNQTGCGPKTMTENLVSTIDAAI